MRKASFLSAFVIGLFVAVGIGVGSNKSALAFSDGDGSSGDPYIVANCEELQDVADNRSAHYLQSGDIDCSLTNPASDGFNAGGTWGDESGFSPIGAALTPFTGSYNGGGFAITNLFINRPATDYVGLFGRVGSGEIEATSVNSSQITGDQYVGAIVGSADGLDEDNQASLIDINISETSVTGSSDVGGLVGTALAYTLIDYSDANDVSVTGASYTGGAIGSTYAASVERTASTGQVTGTGTGSRIGGFVGSASCGSDYTSSASTSDVTATNNTRVGGFVGSATINCEGGSPTFYGINVYGDVVGDDSVGGVVGYASYASFTRARALGTVYGNNSTGGFAGVMIGATVEGTTTGVIDESYSTGAVTGGNDTGGFIGAVEGGRVINSYTRSNVDASAQPGGFIGEVISSGEERIAIIDSFAANTVMAGVYPQGFVGDDDSELADITNSFWDKDYDNINTSFGGVGKTTPEMKSVSTFTTKLGEESWDFDGVWGMVATDNNGYPCIRYFSEEENCGHTPLTDEQDMNGDEIGDDLQDNLSGYTNPYTGKWVVVDVGEGCELNVDDTVDVASFPTEDPEYIYDSGMFEWEAYCGVMGATTTVKLYYYDISMDDMAVRKYTESTQEYSTIEGATLTEETIHGHTVTVATYTITDGGPLDDDGEENGSILDPAGIGLLASSLVTAEEDVQIADSEALAETGQPQNTLSYVATAVFMLGLIFTAASYRLFSTAQSAVRKD
ncbi:hypothetical protein KA047_02100 [Candidatus Saccharibacteria bacterium]|nr:hypothetical protein [Candidatus Saccharibacteria bacterium]